MAGVLMPDDPLPEDPRLPAITNSAELADALAQRWLDNAVTGQDAANEELVAAIIAWKRHRRSLGPRES